MSFDPPYGETLLGHDELAALLPKAREILGHSPTKLDVYQLEQEIYTDVATSLVFEVLDSSLTLAELLSERALRRIHQDLYSEIWAWAGIIRTSVVNIGVNPELIRSELRNSFDNMCYRWNHTGDWTPKELGIVSHAESVRIHPFLDGNGRSTRLLGDLVFLAAQEQTPLKIFSWNVDKARYIRLLREYDQHRDPRKLASFVPTRRLEP